MSIPKMISSIVKWKMSGIYSNHVSAASEKISGAWEIGRLSGFCAGNSITDVEYIYWFIWSYFDRQSVY